MSLRRSAAASYGSQIYVSVVAVLMLPAYVRYLGPEGYGLVGIFIAMQGWFLALDFGLSALLTHQVARWRGGVGRLKAVTESLRRLEGRFAVVATIALLVALTCSPYVADHWLKRDVLPTQTVSRALVLICAVCMARWLAGIYRGIVCGLEQLGRLGALTAISASMRFIVVVPVMAWADDAVSAFFWFQLAVSVIESAAIAWLARRGLAAAGRQPAPAMQSEAPKATGLGWQMALATIGWLAATQADRLLLSRLLPLSDFGHFSLALAVAGGIVMLTAPAGQALMPRMSRLEAAGDQPGLRKLYSTATQAVVVVASTLTATLAVCAGPILWAWTGDRDIAARTEPLLVPYAIGNGLLAIGTLPYYLQFARGDLRLHNIGTGILIAVLLPGMCIAAPRWGAQGTGTVWAAAMALYLLLWTPVVHHRHLPGAAWTWLARDVAPVVMAAAAMAAASWALLPRAAQGRVEQLASIAATATLVTTAAVVASPWARSMVKAAVRSARLRRGSPGKEGTRR